MLKNKVARYLLNKKSYNYIDIISQTPPFTCLFAIFFNKRILSVIN